jgi:hypothetical protein
MTDELRDLIAVLEGCVELEQRQAELLNHILAAPLISVSAGLYGALARSRGAAHPPGASAARPAGPETAGWVRYVRRADPDKPGACPANRSITDGCSSTPGSGSRLSPIPYSASFDAAHSRFLARPLFAYYW